MENLLFFRCPKIWAHYSLIIICLTIGTPNNHHFPFGTNGKVVVLGVPILKHFRVYPSINCKVTSLAYCGTLNMCSFVCGTVSQAKLSMRWLVIHYPVNFE